MTNQNAAVEQQTELEMGLPCKLYSLNDNWHLFQPYLDHPDVVKVLDECMVNYLEQHSHRKWNPADGPWEYTRSTAWVDIIDERMNNDEEFQQEYDALFPDDDMFDIDMYQILYDKYAEKYCPKKGEPDYYKLINGCHWIAPFVAELLTKAFGDEVDAFVIVTDAHSVACFYQEEEGHDVLYYADLLNDWESVQDLEDFLESEVTDPILPFR